jgi:uncharacterized protein DUF928
MKTLKVTLATVLTLAMLWTSLAMTQSKPPEKPVPPSPAKDTPAPATSENAPVYKPPLRGAPSGRVGSGTRGTPERSILLYVLTPDHSGLTTQEQPTLYWYISPSITYPIEFTLAENQTIKPMIEARLGSPSNGGVQRIRLSDYGVRLKIGVEYRWYIAVVRDSNNRSKDILAGGLIERIDPSTNVRTRLSQTGALQAASVYAEAGIWYDALAAISDRIDAAPRDARLREQRAALLEQVRLQDVADLERKTR